MTMTTMKGWRLMSLWGCWLIVVAYHVDGFCVCQGRSPIKGGWLIWREPEAFAARQHQHPFLSSSSSSTVLTAFLHQYSGTSVVFLLLPPWFHIFDRCSPLFIFAGWICWSALIGFVYLRFLHLFICAGWICWWSVWWQIDPPRMSAWSVIDRRLIREQSFNVNSTPSHLQHCPGKPSNSNKNKQNIGMYSCFCLLFKLPKRLNKNIDQGTTDPSLLPNSADLFCSIWSLHLSSE